jgi:hypothetical protein
MFFADILGRILSLRDDEYRHINEMRIRLYEGIRLGCRYGIHCAYDSQKHSSGAAGGDREEGTSENGGSDVRRRERAFDERIRASARD